MKKHSKQENLLYLVAWGILFVAPLLSSYIRSISDPNFTFSWNGVFLVWQMFAGYLVVFLIHNFLVAPLLVYHNRRVLYFSIMTVVLAAFITCQCVSRPDNRRHFGHRPPPMEHRGERSPHFGKHPPGKRRPGMPPPIIGERDIMAIVVLILMLGANLGTKYYFRSRNEHKKLLALEKQNLEQQLEYLKYQINPHFFMNTLNNIHALVDIDPGKAQETIVELSKMMRFVLYEGDKKGVTLSREFDFIRTYIKLMKLRYTDKVRISIDLPDEASDRTIPPLMLISFVENAFKHGISYQQASFVEVSAEVRQEQLHFHCRNSKAAKPNQEKGGVGLANVKKRLNLLYDDRYTLQISDTTDFYNVELTIPLS